MAAPSSSQSRQARQASTSLFKRVWLVMMRSPRASILAVLVAAAALAVAAPSPQQQVMDNNDTSWQRFVRAPSTHTVKPARIHETSGDVLNPDSLLGASTDVGVGPTVLTRQAASDQVPMIVIDFGINVAGLLQIDFAGSTTNGRWTGDGGNKSVVQSRDTLPRPGLKLAFSETLQFLTNRSDFTRSDNANGAQKITPGTDQIAVKQDPYTWLDQLGCENGTQVCADGLHGFRYVKIYLDALDSDAPLTASTGSVGIKSVKLLYSGLLGTPDTFTGHFECSDPDITQWWYDAVYTNDMCTDVFRANDTEPRGAASPTLLGKLVLHDGPKRDRDPYVGDLAVSALTSYLSHDVPEAARNVLEDLAIHQRDDGWIPPASINDYTLPLFDYPLWWVVCTVEHVMYTGNMSFIQTYYPTMAKALDVFYPAHTNNDTGLIEREGYGDYAFLPRSGAVTYYNALYVHALAKAASMADLLGKGEDASRWRSRAAAVGPALVKRNWDAKAGAFFDGGPCGDQAICSVHAQDGNSLAILSGVASNSSSGSASPQSILDYMSTAMAREYGNAFYDSSILDPNADFSNRVYAFISYFELAARFSISSDPKIVGSAFEELRRLYGWMATHDPTVTFWEGIGANGSPYEGGFTSMAHGWSTGIVPLMVNYVLGVTPTKPGFKGWNVRPVPGDLAWARGAVPTPSGAISVQWQMAGGGRNGLFWMQVTAPGDTSGTVAVPLPGGAKVLTLNGELVFDVQARSAARGARQEGGFVLVDVTGGKHVFVVE